MKNNIVIEESFAYYRILLINRTNSYILLCRFKVHPSWKFCEFYINWLYYYQPCLDCLFIGPYFGMWALKQRLKNSVLFTCRIWSLACLTWYHVVHSKGWLRKTSDFCWTEWETSVRRRWLDTRRSMTKVVRMCLVFTFYTCWPTGTKWLVRCSYKHVTSEYLYTSSR